ncbi:phosphotransferase enzyme family protein [Sclerotinia borealis F-4128]|uniref:Phosphotransferase enzyme family protein n=1 Tax=Sclerotinia borealis (strain F-4128) TaxID=1432307 RepID=W9C261_SCLBF|nr:phosphotransferase enzyme family protein [Sclerotinia borealis F-4128]
MYFDPIAQERQDRNFQIWIGQLLKGDPEQLACQLAKKHRPGHKLGAALWKNGAYNVCYRVRYEDGFHAIVRFSALGKTVYRTEKVENEAIVLQYLHQHTNVPVPQVLGWGTCWVGPYTVEELIEGDLISVALKDPTQEGRPNLNPKISDRALKVAYRAMANIVLELSKPEFTRIGCLVKTGEEFDIGRRPLSIRLSELSISANLAPEHLTQSTFASSTEYFDLLAEQHLSQLRYQRNDVVENELDCKKKYISRCLFRRVVRQVSAEYVNEPFRLFCDDFRPSNVLANMERLQISAVIDLEFSYAAPSEFTYAAPWWLLLQGPEDWEGDLNDFLTRYTPRLELFLSALRECEEQQIKNGILVDSQRLSARMEQSMHNGLFWVCIAARHSQMFDEVYWAFLDEKYFGPFVALEDRVELLNEEEKNELTKLFDLKQEQAKDKTLDIYYPSTDLMRL